MNKKNLVILSLAAFVILCCFGLKSAHLMATTKTQSTAQTKIIVEAATSFENLLQADQRSKLIFPFVRQQNATKAVFKRTQMMGGPPGGPDDKNPMPGGKPPEHQPDKNEMGKGPGGGPGKGGSFPGFVGEQYGQAVWSNYPVSDVPRPGLQLGSLNAQQREAAMHLLHVLLSPKGYQKVLDIMGSDQALADAGTNFASGKDRYTIAIFGTPSTTAPWMVEFGGHHLGLNIVIAGSHGALTPTLTGAQPSVYQSNGKTVRVLAEENDKAFSLLGSLNEDQRKKAILNYRVDDLVLGPGHDGEVIVPEGLKASAMTIAQKEKLLDLISQWAGIISNPYVQTRMEEIKVGINDTYFAWSGPTSHEPEKNGSSYYRIQGPKVIIEFSPQGVGGDLTMHVHTIYRDPTNEYGNAFTAK